MAGLGKTAHLAVLLVAIAVLLYAVTTSIRRGPDVGEEESGGAPARELLPDVGCPVAFTDAPNFRGAYHCFQLGGVRDLDLRGTGLRDPEARRKGGDARNAAASGASFQPDGAVFSVGVRRGYHLVAFSEPDYRGDVVIDRRGPSYRSYRPLRDPEPLSLACGDRLQMAKKGELLGTRHRERRKASDAPVPRSLRVHLSRNYDDEEDENTRW